MLKNLPNVSKMASELSKAESILRTRQVLRQWRDDGTLGSNLKRTLRNGFAQSIFSATSHPDVPALSDLHMLEPRAGDTEVSIADIVSFLGPTGVWDKHYGRALHTWTPTKNVFGKNYTSSVKAHDPTPLQNYLQKIEDGWKIRQSQASERDQESSSGAAESEERSPTDQELDLLAEQVTRQVSTCLDNEVEDSKVSTIV